MTFEKVEKKLLKKVYRWFILYITTRYKPIQWYLHNREYKTNCVNSKGKINESDICKKKNKLWRNNE